MRLGGNPVGLGCARPNEKNSYVCGPIDTYSTAQVLPPNRNYWKCDYIWDEQPLAYFFNMGVKFDPKSQGISIIIKNSKAPNLTVVLSRNRDILTPAYRRAGPYEVIMEYCGCCELTRGGIRVAKIKRRRKSKW